MGLCIQFKPTTPDFSKSMDVLSGRLTSRLWKSPCCTPRPGGLRRYSCIETDGAFIRRGSSIMKWRRTFFWRYFAWLGNREALFPNTPYSFESGGHPDRYQLTQEAFEHFHTIAHSPERFVYLSVWRYGSRGATLAYLGRRCWGDFKRTGAVNSKYLRCFCRGGEVLGTYPWRLAKHRGRLITNCI